MMESKDIFENAQQLFLEGKMNESVDLFSKAIENGEKTEIAYLSRGVAYLKTNQVEMAIKDFGSAVNLNESNVRAHFYRGIAYMLENKYSEAITDFDITILLEPDNGEAFFARGTAYAQIGDDYEANKNIKTAITFSEANIYGLQESIGLWRPQFDKAMMIMTDKDKAPAMVLTDEEITKVKKWLDDETYH